MHFLEFEFSDGGPLSLITSTLHVYVTLTLDCCFLTMTHVLTYSAAPLFSLFLLGAFFFNDEMKLQAS